MRLVARAAGSPGPALDLHSLQPVGLRDCASLVASSAASLAVRSRASSSLTSASRSAWPAAPSARPPAPDGPPAWPARPRPAGRGRRRPHARPPPWRRARAPGSPRLGRIARIAPAASVHRLHAHDAHLARRLGPGLPVRDDLRVRAKHPGQRRRQGDPQRQHAGQQAQTLRQPATASAAPAFARRGLVVPGLAQVALAAPCGHVAIQTASLIRKLRLHIAESALRVMRFDRVSI